MGSWCSRRKLQTSSASIEEHNFSISSHGLPSPQAPVQAASSSQTTFPKGLPQEHLVTTPPLLPPRQTSRQTAKYKSSELPPTVDATIAVAAFRSQREGLLQLIRNCISSLANSLYAQFLIPEDARERATNESVGTSERSVALLDCVEARSKALPADFIKIVQILESDPYLEAMASKLVCSYLTASQLTDTSSPISAATSHYSSYLKALYKQSPISPVNKWPPTPSKEYVQLALVQERDKCRDEYIGHVLEGNVKQILHLRKEISIEQIFLVNTHENSVNMCKRLILIEGAPGIGKSTFAWELCRKWEELECMQKFCLVVLLRLRERKVQKITEISDLFKSCGATDYKSISTEVSQNHGYGVLFILDGFDELPQSLQHEGFLMDLITKTVLPESTVVVTSRPSATAQLLTSCRPLIWKHIEILGFTQEGVEAYAATIFSDPSELERFKKYISASKNPAINSLMYLPINAAIVVQIFRESKSRSTLPFNLTQLYTQLCLTILNKQMKTEQHSTNIQTFKDLPRDLHEQFVELSRIAFEGIKTQQVIFHDVNLSCHFGFLDSASSLYGGGEISYNFLHLTLQEFFAAYYISQFPHQGLKYFSEGKQWNVVWRFVAGLTKFEVLKSSSFTSSFVGQDQFFIHCLFEANTALDFEAIFGTRTYEINYALPITTYTEFDFFALGYCVVNCSTVASSWNIECLCSQEFLHGLMTSTSHKHGTIKQFHLTTSIYKPLYFEIRPDEFIGQMIKITPFKAIIEFSVHDILNDSSTTLLRLSELIPQLTNLKKLRIPCHLLESKGNDSMKLLLQQLLNSTVTSLTINGFEMQYILEQQSSVATSLSALLHPLTGTLQELILTFALHLVNYDALIELVSQPSSLQHLSLSGSNNLCTFNTSNTLNKLTITSHDFTFNLVEDVVRIIEESQELREMKLNIFNLNNESDLFIIKAIISSLKRNSNLKTLLLSYNHKPDYYDVIEELSSVDHRLELSCNH